VVVLVAAFVIMVLVFVVACHMFCVHILSLLAFTHSIQWFVCVLCGNILIASFCLCNITGFVASAL
jgi:hypothetical protein